MGDKIHQDQFAEAKKLIQDWVDKQGHDRCWYYPEVFERLATLFKIRQTSQSGLPIRSEFEAGCRRYQSEEYSSTK